MKNKILYCLVLIICLASCTKSWLGDNVDPATPQKVSANNLLAPMFFNMERGIAGDVRYIGRYIQNFGLNTGNDPYERHGYARNSDAMGEIWRMTYFGIGTNIENMISDAKSGQKWEFVGVGLALRAWCFQVTTDYHGPIICKQAFEPNRSQFDYDNEEYVYGEVVKLCEESLEYLNKTDGVQGVAAQFPSADIVYNGDKTKWKKFVYGILARNAHNRFNKASYDAAKVIDYASKALADNTDNFIIPNAGTNSDNSSNYGSAKIPSTYPSLSGSYVQGAMIANLMNGTIFANVIDPRAPIMLSVSPDGKYRGVVVVQGDPNRNTSTTVINPTEIPNVYGFKSGVSPAVATGRYLFKDNAGFPIMTAAEMQFIKAEAAFKKNDPGTAYTSYKNGITLNMDWLGVTEVNKTTYMLSAAVPQTQNLLSVKDILLQKYIALWAFGGVEIWSDMRRYQYDVNIYTGFTTLPNSTLTYGTLFEDNGNKLAYRVRPRYNSEYVWNLSALQAVGGDKIDYHTLPTWISKP